ncbi:MAG: TetR/AcrR family transcriptional regulator [Fibrobacterota bacterium]|nr:TetR/AcrR family transcriptional regulator [Fibrobacterota bacterium]
MSDLRGRILECAVDVYLEQGLKGLSMRHVGEKLRVSATAIYRHYRNKEDLVHNVIGEAVKIFGAYLFAALSGRTPEERYKLSCEAYLSFALEKSKYYEVIFLAPSQLGEEGLPEELQQKSNATFQFLVDRVQECMESGYLRKDDAYSVAMTLWAHGHGLVSIYLAKKCPLDEAGLRKLYWESHGRLLNGLLMVR